MQEASKLLEVEKAEVKVMTDLLAPGAGSCLHCCAHDTLSSGDVSGMHDICGSCCGLGVGS